MGVSSLRLFINSDEVCNMLTSPFVHEQNSIFKDTAMGAVIPKEVKMLETFPYSKTMYFLLSISHRNDLNRCNNNFTLQIDFVVSVQLEGIKIFNWNAYKILGLNDPLYNDGLGVYSVLIKLGQHKEALYTLKQVLHFQQFRLDMRNCIIDRCTTN